MDQPAAVQNKRPAEDAEAHENKKAKAEIPEGMSKNQWKKLQKQKRWEEGKEEYRLRRREKKKAAKVRKAELKESGVKDFKNYHEESKRPIPQTQISSGVHVIMDCEFDELMSDKEIVSMSNQITRCYLAKRHSAYDIGLTVSTFNKRLQLRFESRVLDYHKWKGITFTHNETLAESLPTDPEELQKYVYLTADTDEELTTLDEGHTYIIGGIVDKNRHKLLCLNKAKKLGLRVGRLPIGRFIQLNGRQVLATSHVYEIMCQWFESGKDWGQAFDAVLPPRKLKPETQREEEAKETEGGDEGSD